MRTTGATNITPFALRARIATSNSNEIKHLANIAGNPRDHFLGLLRHQKNFLDWVERRHEIIVDLQKKNHDLKGVDPGKGPSGAKGATFKKYRWYSEQLVLLEAVNAFEAFFKRSFVQLGEILQDYVQPEIMKDRKIDARLLWAITERLSVPALIFEQSLFHDLDTIDECTHMLVRAKRYMQKSNPNQLKDRVRALRGIFQIRHTLSHNSGLITDSDAAKFKRIGFTVTAKEVVDPDKDALGLAIFRELESEAKDFTFWLAEKTADFLSDCTANRGLVASARTRQELETLLGAESCWNRVSWT